MNLDITGSYTITIPIQTMFLNTSFKISRNNLITFFGESFFMNRCINNDFDPINFIVLGDTSNAPLKEDMKLGNETSRHKCVCLADLNEKQLILTATVKSKEIIGTTEIGVHNGQVLISHDKYSKIDDAFMGIAGEVKLEYVFQFSTGALKGGWKNSSNNFVFYTYEPNNVIGVFDRNSDVWYVRCDSLNDLNAIRGAYHVDNTTKNLYIRPYLDLSLEELEKKDIIVQVK